MSKFFPLRAVPYGKEKHHYHIWLPLLNVLFACDPFQNDNFSYRKEFAPRMSEIFPLRAVPYGMKNHFYHIWLPLLNVTIFYARA